MRTDVREECEPSFFLHRSDGQRSVDALSLESWIPIIPVEGKK